MRPGICPWGPPPGCRAGDRNRGFALRPRKLGPRATLGARPRKLGPRATLGARPRKLGPRATLGARPRKLGPRATLGARPRKLGPRATLPPLVQRHVIPRAVPRVDLARPRDLLLLVVDHLQPLGDPAAGARDGEEHG